MKLSIKPIFGRSEMIIAAMAFLIVSALAWNIHAGIYYVSTSGSDASGDGTKTAPWLTIAYAVDQCSASEEEPARIRIAGGIYYENIEMKPYVRINGGYSPPGWTRDITGNPSIVRPESSSANYTIAAAENTTIDGLYIQNGKTGILCENCSPVIMSCRITGNTTAGIMGTGSNSSPEINSNEIRSNKEGVYLYNAGFASMEYNIIEEKTGNDVTIQGDSHRISNNSLRKNALSALNISYMTTGTISSNAIHRNGYYGIFCNFSPPDIYNNRIAFNDRDGIFCSSGSLPRIIYNSFYMNGNGITMRDSSPDIINNIFMKNDAFGIYEVYRNSAPVFKNNCLWENQSGNYKDGGTTVCQTTEDFENLLDNNGAEVSGNFAENPHISDPANENFHLLPLSPCIAAAVPVADISEDYEGDLRSVSNPDIGADEYIDLFYYAFTNGNQGWNYVSVPSVFTPPEHSDSEGHLTLVSKDDNTYGYWESPCGAMAVFDDYIYRGTFKVSTNVSDQSVVPGMRLRFNEADFQMGMEMLINSNQDGAASPTPDGDTYELYYLPVQGSDIKQERSADLLSSFDLVNLTDLDQEDGSLFLEEMTLEWISKSSVEEKFTLETEFDFEDGTDGWELRTVPSTFDAPTLETGTSFIGLRAAGSNTFGYLESEAQAVTSGRLYRARFFVTTDTYPRSVVPMLRIRANSVINQAGFGVVVDSNGNGDSSPVPNKWTAYDIYFAPPPSVETDGVFLSFDLVNLNPNDNGNGALYLDRVEVSSAALPLF